MAANKETGEGQSAGGAAGSDDKVNEQLRVAFNDLLRLSPQQNSGEDVQSPLSPISHHLDHATSERKATYNRLLAIGNQTNKRPWQHMPIDMPPHPTLSLNFSPGLVPHALCCRSRGAGPAHMSAILTETNDAAPARAHDKAAVNCKPHE